MKKIISLFYTVALLLALSFVLVGCDILDDSDDFSYDKYDRLFDDSYENDDEKDEEAGTEAEKDDQGEKSHRLSMADRRYLSRRDYADNFGYFDRENVREYESKLIEFFELEYGIDLTGRFDSLVMYLYDNVAYNKYVLGFTEPEYNWIFINRDLYEDEPEYFVGTWSHECIHYLGIHYNGPFYQALYEAITEAVSLDFSNWMGEENYPTDAYLPMVDYAKRMIDANPALVSVTMTSGPWHHIIDDINETLSDVTFTVFEVPEYDTIAQHLSTCLEAVKTGEYGELGGEEKVRAAIEEAVSAYCAKFSVDETEDKLP